MFDNFLLYITTGILGSLTPLLDKFNLENFKWYEYLFLREIVFIICLAVMIYFFSHKNIFERVKNLNNKNSSLLLGGCILSFIYVLLIFYIFDSDLKKGSISKVVITLMITTIISSFLIDKFYLGTKFNYINYLGVVLLSSGIIFLKGF